jgi:hypothetical protein
MGMRNSITPKIIVSVVDFLLTISFEARSYGPFRLTPIQELQPIFS